MDTNAAVIIHALFNKYEINESAGFCDSDVDKLLDLANSEADLSKLSQRDKNELLNVITIYTQSAVSVRNNSVPEKTVDTLWATRFYDYAKCYSDREEQKLWSKILCNEFTTPGSYFKRTLNVLFNAEKFEIDWFYEVSKYVFDKGCIPSFILNDNKYYAFNKFQTIVDGGFVNPSLAGISYDKEERMRFGSADVIFKMEKGPYGLNVYTLTDAGMQLYDLRAEKSEDVFLNDLKGRMEKNAAIKEVIIERKE